MALVTYPLNNIEYSAEDAELFHVTRTSGVYAKNSFDYSLTGADNTIVINTGIGWIKNSEFSGKVIALKERISLDMGLADSVYPRIDAVVIQFDANSNETNIIVKNGVASSEPIPPEVLRDESTYELHLYHVKRVAGSLHITPGNITDLRINSSYCGLMADSVTEIDTSAIQKQISELVESLRNYVPPIESSDYPGCYYNVVNGEEEWVNPPMILGVEYRTTERYNGKPVYVKLINLGLVPQTDVKDTRFSDTNTVRPIEVKGTIGAGYDNLYCTTPHHGNTSQTQSISISAVNYNYIRCTSSYNIGGNLYARAIVKYWKFTD